MKINRMLSVVAVTAVLGAGLAAAPSEAGAPSTHSSASDKAAKGKPFSATIKASKKSQDVKKLLVISGKVSPAIKGTKVTLQKKLEDGAWTDEASLKTTGSGKYSYNDHPKTPGPRQYRVLVPGTSKHKAGKSKNVAVTLYEWQDLGSVPVRSNGGSTYRTDSVSINGNTYEPGIEGNYYGGYDEGFIDWNLDRRCTEMKVRLGNEDDSDDAAIANIQIVKDGTAAYTHSFALTESAQRSFNLDDVFRLKFAWTSSNPQAGPENQDGAHPVLAEPLVHCAF